MNALDLTPSIIPKSDQINAEDLLTGPATFTIREVTAGSVEQPFNFMLAETDRAYRPSKTMRRVIVNAWGPDARTYAARSLTLYREPTIKFGGVEVGGIRISHMSHINGTVELMAQTTRGKREKFTVHPLKTTEPAAPSAQTAANELVVPEGGLGEALKALDPNQRKALYEFCGITKGMKVEDVRGLLADKYGQLKLPDYDGEPVPVTVLGAIYAERAQHASAEAFQHWLDTGEDLDPGDQARLTEVAP